MQGFWTCDTILQVYLKNLQQPSQTQHKAPPGSDCFTQSSPQSNPWIPDETLTSHSSTDVIRIKKRMRQPDTRSREPFSRHPQPYKSHGILQARNTDQTHEVKSLIPKGLKT